MKSSILNRMLDFLFNDEGIKKDAMPPRRKLAMKGHGMASNTGMNIINYTRNAGYLFG